MFIRMTLRITILVLLLLFNVLFACKSPNRKKLLQDEDKKTLPSKPPIDPDTTEKNALDDDGTEKTEYDDSHYNEEDDDENDDDKREAIDYEYISSDDAYLTMLKFITDMNKGICLRTEMKKDKTILRPEFNEDSKIVTTVVDKKDVPSGNRIIVYLNYKHFKNDTFEVIAPNLKHIFHSQRIRAQSNVVGTYTFHFYPTNSRDAIDDKQYMTATINFHAGYGSLYRPDCSDRLRNIYAVGKKADNSPFRIPVSMSYKIPGKPVKKIQLPHRLQVTLLKAFIGGKYIVPKTVPLNANSNAAITTAEQTLDTAS